MTDWLRDGAGRRRCTIYTGRSRYLVRWKALCARFLRITVGTVASIIYIPIKDTIILLSLLSLLSYCTGTIGRRKKLIGTLLFNTFNVQYKHERHELQDASFLRYILAVFYGIIGKYNCQAPRIKRIRTKYKSISLSVSIS